MGYLPKPIGDRFNQERAKFFRAPAPYCPFCKLAGLGTHRYVLSEDGVRLTCPSCKDGRFATDDDRRRYGDPA